MIYRTRSEHVNKYTTDEPMIYRTRNEHVNKYTTDVVVQFDYKYDAYCLWYL